MLKPGKYVGRPFDWSFVESKKGNVMIAVRFKIEEGGKSEFLTWYGHLEATEKARQYAMKALVACGLKGNDLSILERGVAEKGLDTSSDVRLTVISEEGTNGKTYTKVQYVNPMSGGFRNKADSGKLSVLKGLKADLAVARQEMNMPAEKAKSFDETETDDIPF